MVALVTRRRCLTTDTAAGTTSRPNSKCAPANPEVRYPRRPLNPRKRRLRANLLVTSGRFFGRVPLPWRFRAIFVSIFGRIVFGTFCASVVTDLRQCALSFIAPDLCALLSKLATARAEFVSISCHFQFDFETRKGAKDSEKPDPLRASRSPRQSTVTRPCNDVSQNRSATHRQSSRWSFHRLKSGSRRVRSASLRFPTKIANHISERRVAMRSRPVHIPGAARLDGHKHRGAGASSFGKLVTPMLRRYCLARRWIRSSAVRVAWSQIPMRGVVNFLSQRCCCDAPKRGRLNRL